MKLEEYLVIRNGLDRNGNCNKFLSRGEARILNLDITKKGWAKNEQELDDLLIKKCIDHVLKSDWIKTKSKNRISDFLRETQFYPDVKKLYLLKNTENLYKIGISKDPFRRARALASSGGYKIKVVAVWEVPMAFRQEQELHKIFRRQREVGEWFTGSFDHTLIEKHITQDFERVYLDS